MCFDQNVKFFGRKGAWKGDWFDVIIKTDTVMLLKFLCTEGPVWKVSVVDAWNICVVGDA